MSTLDELNRFTAKLAEQVADLQAQVTSLKARVFYLEDDREEAEHAAANPPTALLQFEGPPPTYHETEDEEHQAAVNASRRERHDALAVAVLQASATLYAVPSWKLDWPETVRRVLHVLEALRSCRELSASASRIAPGSEASPLLAQLLLASGDLAPRPQGDRS